MAYIAHLCKELYVLQKEYSLYNIPINLYRGNKIHSRLRQAGSDGVVINSHRFKIIVMIVYYDHIELQYNNISNERRDYEYYVTVPTLSDKELVALLKKCIKRIQSRFYLK